MVRKKCDLCKKGFNATRNSAKYCSKRCYRRSPEAKEWQKTYDASPAKLKYWYSSAGRASYRRGMTRHELRVAIKLMGGEQKKSITDSYYHLVELVKNNEKKAKKILKGGAPDAIEGLVEFKFGIDSLRSHQLLSDILMKRKGRVRWIPSWDSLEKTLAGERNESILFDSYLSYLQWCDKTKTFDFQ